MDLTGLIPLAAVAIVGVLWRMHGKLSKIEERLDNHIEHLVEDMRSVKSLLLEHIKGHKAD